MNNKKIYARQVPPEYQESPLQLCDEFPENVFVYGNRDYIERAERLNELRNALENIADEFEALQQGYFTAVTLADILPQKDSGEAYTRPERLELVRLAFEYRDSLNYTAAENALIRALEIVSGEEYERACIRGCCQGDWQYLIYPAAYGDKFRETFEIEYFNTGTEWIIHDGDDAPEEPEEIGGYSIYCYSYDPRVEIAAEHGASPDDVILYEFNGWARAASYKAVTA